MNAGRGMLALGLTLAACGSSVEPPGSDGGAQDRDAGAEGTDAGRSCGRGGDGWDSAGDGVDQNGDGIDGFDWDCDGFASTGSGGADCDDFHGDVNPAAPESDSPRLRPTALTDWGYLELDGVARDADGSVVVLFQDYRDEESGPYLGRIGESGWSITPLHLGYQAGAGLGPASTVHSVRDCAGGLCYARFVAGEWTEEVVDSTPAVSACLAFESGGSPVIVWYSRNETNGFSRAFVSRPSRDGWQTEWLVDGVSGIQCAVDDSGALHVLYDHPGAVTYVVQRQGLWAYSLPFPEEPSAGCRMVVDHSGNAHFLKVGRTVVLATNATGDWTYEEVPIDHADGVHAAATANDGSLVVLFSSSGRGRPGLTVATRDAAGWQLDPISLPASAIAYLLVDDGIEVIDDEEEPLPEDPCGKCPVPRLRLRYTALGAFDENCDGVAE